MIARSEIPCSRCGEPAPVHASFCPSCEWLLSTPYPMPRRARPANQRRGQVVPLPSVASNARSAAPPASADAAAPTPPSGRRHGFPWKALVYAALGYGGADALVHVLTVLGWWH